MSKKTLKISAEDEEQRKELYQTILELKAKIQYGEELVLYFNGTMKYFRFPENRVKGEDLIDWDLNGWKLKNELAAIEKMYKKNYE